MFVNLKHHRKQKKALNILLDFNNGISELLYGGAAGGGKSWIGCEWIIIMAITYPGTRYLIGRAKLLSLKQSTLNTFWDVCKVMKLKKGTHFTFNGQTNTITFWNGSEVILKDLFQYPSDPEFDSLGSTEFTAAFIDEVNQVTEKAKMIVRSRIRYKLDEYGITPKILMTCNPARNWVYNEYYKPAKEGKLKPYRAYIHALPTDNPYVTKSYVESLMLLDDISKNRLLYGLWEYADELAMFDLSKIQDALNMRRKVRKGLRYFIAADVARLGKDKTVMMVCSESLEVVEIIETQHRDLKAADPKHKPGKHDAATIRRLMEKYDVSEYDVAVDADGVGGGVTDHFDDVEQIVNNSKALFGENYYNLKTQLYFKLAQVVNDGELSFTKATPKKEKRERGEYEWSWKTSITDEQAETITQELQVLKREKVEMDGKVCMTTKDAIKKQIGRSPDYADCLAYLMFFFLDDTEAEYDGFAIG